MNSKRILALVIFAFLVCSQIAEANYSCKVIVKYPFASRHQYDNLGNIIFSDSLVTSRLIKLIIFHAETESLYQEGVTNDSGYANFSFDRWADNTLVTIDNIIRLAIDFPNTDRVIRTDGKITFEHLKYPDVDFRKSPEEIEIILPMTVTKDEFIIGNTSWLNVCNFAVMNDMHISEG